MRTTKQKPTKHASPSITTNSGLRITPDKISLTITSRDAVVKHIEVPLGGDVIKGGELSNSEKLMETILAMVKQSAMADKYVTLGVPEHSAFVKTFSFSKENINDVRDRVVLESEPYLPMSIDSMYLDWGWLDKENGVIQVVAMPKDIVDKYLTVANKTGVIPLAIEPSGLTLGRLAGKVELPTLVIDAETTTTIIVLEANSGINLSAVSQSPELGKLSSDITQIISEMIVFYKKKFNQDVGKILFTGSLQDQLKNYLPPAPPSEPLKSGFSAKQNEFMGCALARMPIAPPEDATTINLIPPGIQANYDQAAAHHLKKRLLFVSIFFLTVLNILNGLVLFQAMRTKSSLVSMTEVDENLSEIGLLEQIKQINKKSEGIVQIGKSRKIFSSTFNNVLSKVPNDLIISYIKLDADTHQVTVRGFAQTREQLLALKKQIEDDPEFTNVSLPLSVLEKPDEVDFSIFFNWDENTETAEQNK